MNLKATAEMLNDWLGEGGIPVPRHEAQERANVCLECPKNEPGRLDEFFKAPVAAFIRSQIEAKNGMKVRVEGEKELHICSVCGCVLKLKVHTPIKHVEKVTDDETLKAFPEYCWVPKQIAMEFEHNPT